MLELHIRSEEYLLKKAITLELFQQSVWVKGEREDAKSIR